MPEPSMLDDISISFAAQEPWPENVKLFQPYEVEQILLPDNASCLAVQAFLKMCHLPFEVEMRWNAEFMSPSGRVPFIKCGAFVVSELEPIVQFCSNKGVTLTAQLSTEERAEMRAYMSLITNVLLNAELYISWLDPDTYNTVTRARNASVYPWPLGWLQTRAKRNAVTKRLKALNWHDKTLDRVLSDVEQCCNSLSQRLGDREYFFGIPTPMDAWIYGHIRALLGAVGPKAHLMIRPITTVLLKHTLRVANITGMKLQLQEEYLVSQALAAPTHEPRPCSSYDRTPPNIRSERSVSERSVKRPHVSFKAKDRLGKGDSVFGFKPFVAKKVLVMTSQDDDVPHERNQKHEDEVLEKNISVKETFENTVDNVSETLQEKGDQDFDGNTLADGVEFPERKEFEVIEECGENNEDMESNYEILSEIQNESNFNTQVTCENALNALEEADNFDLNASFCDAKDVFEDQNESVVAYMKDASGRLEKAFEVVEEAETVV